MTGFTTDKVSPHGYLPDYLRLAATLGTAAVVCEVGVKHGESLVLWQHLFPHSAAIIGVDHDASATWPDGTIRVDGKQEDPGLRDLVAQHAPGGCDLIVDDASHKASLTAATFATLWPLVRPGGFYVVEDWADPWVDPDLPRWHGDELVDYVPRLIEALKDGADSVSYTPQGLAIIRRGR
jgi:Methyltransferase domain